MPIDIEVPIAQSVANGVTTAFPHTFTVLDTDDLVVKVDTAGVITYPVFGSDYTVTGLGSNSGSVVFSVAPVATAVVTRYRDTKLKRTTDYQENGDLLANTLDADIDRLWMALQERVAGGTIAPTSMRVPAGETISELPKASDRALRVLAFDSLGAPLLIAGVDSGSAAALALDVASAASATKGAGQIGYNAALSYLAGSVGYALKALASLCAALPWANITGKPTTVAGYGITDAFYAGDTKHSWQTTDHGRWLLLTTAARTIGSAASGATARANADTLALYTQLWNTLSNTDCPVSGGRGASAAADFAANKTLQLPLMSGLTLKGHHGGDGTLTTDTSRALGSYEADANKAHTHSFAGSSGPGATSQISSTTGQAPGFVTTSSNGGLEALVRNRSINIFIYF